MHILRPVDLKVEVAKCMVEDLKLAKFVLLIISGKTFIT